MQASPLGYDHDADGSVSPEEAACGRIVDANHNGKIDETETKTFVAFLRGARGRSNVTATRR